VGVYQPRLDVNGEVISFWPLLSVTWGGILKNWEKRRAILVPVDPIVSKTQPFENVKINNEMYGHPDAVFRDNVQMAIHFLVNFDIFEWLCLAYYWVYLHQT